jgi:hypothetical protein
MNSCHACSEHAHNSSMCLTWFVATNSCVCNEYTISVSALSLIAASEYEKFIDKIHKRSAKCVSLQAVPNTYTGHIGSWHSTTLSTHAYVSRLSYSGSTARPSYQMQSTDTKWCGNKPARLRSCTLWEHLRPLPVACNSNSISSAACECDGTRSE